MTFDELNVGGIFELYGNYYIKISTIVSMSTAYNAVDLCSGHAFYFEPTRRIFKCKMVEVIK